MQAVVDDDEEVVDIAPCEGPIAEEVEEVVDLDAVEVYQPISYEDELARQANAKKRRRVSIASRWTPSEEETLRALVAELGTNGRLTANQWEIVAQRLGGSRSTSSITQHYNIMCKGLIKGEQVGAVPTAAEVVAAGVTAAVTANPAIAATVATAPTAATATDAPTAVVAVSAEQSAEAGDTVHATIAHAVDEVPAVASGLPVPQVPQVPQVPRCRRCRRWRPPALPRRSHVASAPGINNGGHLASVAAIITAASITAAGAASSIPTPYGMSSAEQRTALPPGWTTVRHEAPAGRTVYHGPKGQRVRSKTQAWRSHEQQFTSAAPAFAFSGAGGGGGGGRPLPTARAMAGRSRMVAVRQLWQRRWPRPTWSARWAVLRHRHSGRQRAQWRARVSR